METAGVVVLALFGGAIFIVILGGLATLIVLHIRQRKMQIEISAEFRAAVDKLGTLTQKLAADVDGSISGARTSFGGIRTDIKAALEAHGNLVADTLAKHEAAFQEKLGKINGAALEVACARAVKASNQIVQVASFLQSLMTSGAEPASAEAPAAEAYGPEDTVYARRSHTAAVDEAISGLEDLENMSEMAPAEG